MIKCYLVLMFLLLSTNVLADNQTDSDAIFDWAEKNIPEYFSTTGEVITYNSVEYQSKTYIARRYLATNVYIGTNNGMVYYFSEDIFNGLLEVNTMRKFLNIIAAEDNPRFNDTGAIKCNNTVQKNLTCPLTDFPGQDAEYGRDVTFNDDSDGHAGFSFTKLDSNGNEVAKNDNNWSCIKDNVTGLIWEVKTDDRRLRSNNWIFTWYDSSNTIRLGEANGGLCYDKENCDTEKYIEQVNTETLCGSNDWRLPTVPELLSLITLNQSYGVIDSDYFPNTQTNHYWTSNSKIEATSSANDLSSKAWYIHYGSGELNYSDYTERKFIRLVRTE